MHNQSFVRSQGECLKFKLHSLLHEHRHMNRWGPLGPFSAYRFESFHHLLNQVDSTCKKNMLWTIAIKNSLCIASTLLFKTPLRCRGMSTPTRMSFKALIRDIPSCYFNLQDFRAKEVFVYKEVEGD